MFTIKKCIIYFIGLLSSILHLNHSIAQESPDANSVFPKKKNNEQGEIYTTLRNQVLSLTAEQIPPQNQIIGLLMETGYPECIISLAAIADGAASIYFSDGGGIIGAGEHKEVSLQAITLIKVSSSFIQNMKKTTEFSLPQEGHTKFYIITTSGIFTAEALEDDLGNERHMLSPLFHQGHELIFTIRTVVEKLDAKNKTK